ncbi:hypothetical protein [Agromyces ramosus]|uniref:FtsX-like permease family protein n=1 Tax=Agromyces ramosus TaxID=33879 RepID=A0ABU0R4Y9_9MICO|nr:hypothetical protein [Agromyces ramosus]MDQ0893150.1 hypothetical protein [Agromyces ramosus]
MGSARTSFARAAARAGVLGSIAAVVFLLAGLGTAVVDSLAGASVGGLRSGLAAASGIDGAARWQIRLSSDPAAQADAAASVLDRMIVPHGASWSRSVETAPVDATGPAGPFGAVLLADDGVADRSQLVSGSWPTEPQAVADADGALPATLHAEAAAALGLEPGDLVELGGGGRLLVVGTWLPLDPNEPVWFGEPAVATGLVDDGAGPFLVPEEALLDVPAATDVRWTALVDAGTMTPEVARTLRAALPNVEPALRAQEAIGADGLSALGALDATLDRLLAGLGAVRAIAPLPVLLLAFAGFAALARLAALLGASRRGETVLLRARGASATRLTRDAAAEVLVLGVPAATLGAAAGLALLVLLRPGEARDVAIAWVAASVAVVGALVLVAGQAWRESRRPVVRGSGDEVGRMPRTLVAGGVVLVAVVAAVSLWQFRLYGSPLVPTVSGALEIDPIAVLAPVLVLLALSLAAVGLSRPIDLLLERAAAARPGLTPALPMRQLARRAALYASASLVSILAVAGLTLAAAFAGAWQDFDRAAAAVTTGGDVQVAFAGRDVVRGDDPFALGDPFAGVEGITASGPVYRGEIRIGSDRSTIVAAPVAQLPAIAPGTHAAADGGALAESAATAGVEIPGGAVALEYVARVAAPPRTPGTVSISAWLLGDGGAATRLPAGSFAVESGGGTGRFELPDAAGLRFLGLEATLTGAQGADDVRVSLGDVALDPATDPAPDLQLDGELTVSSADPSDRAPLAAGADIGLPVTLGSALAARIQARVGDEFSFRILSGGAEVDAVVADIVPAVPAAGGDGVLADLGALEQYAFSADAGVPQYGQRWLATSDPAVVAAELERDRQVAMTVTTRQLASSAMLIGPAVTALWAGAVGALVFALIAIIALVAALRTARLGEVSVLRVLGMPARAQARARLAELSVTLGTAVVVGVAVGLLTALVTARELARAAVAGAPEVLPVGFAVDWLPWATALVAFLVAAVTIGAVASNAVRRDASRPARPEEER